MSSLPQRTQLSDIDKRIAELEAALEEDEASSSDNSSTSSSSDDDKSAVSDNDDNTAGSTSSSSCSSSSRSSASVSAMPLILGNLNDDDRIVPLPAHLLPETYARAKKYARQKSGRGHATLAHNVHNSSGGGRGNPNKARDHSKRDKYFWRSAREEAMKAYEPHHNKALFCRLCRIDFVDADALFRHRGMQAHKDAAAMERKLTFCNLCKKQFTSVHQLSEHIKGKWHKQRTAVIMSKNGRGRGQASSGRGGVVRGGAGRGGARGGITSRLCSRGRGRGGFRGGSGRAGAGGRGQGRGHSRGRSHL